MSERAAVCAHARVSGARAFQEHPTRSDDRRHRRRCRRRRRASADIDNDDCCRQLTLLVVKHRKKQSSARRRAKCWRLKTRGGSFSHKKSASKIASGGGGHSSRDRECAAASAKRATPNFSRATFETGARAAAADCWRASGAKNGCRAARNPERPAHIASSVSMLAVDVDATSDEPPIGLAPSPLTGGYKTRFAFACATRIWSAEDRALRS